MYFSPLNLSALIHLSWFWVLSTILILITFGTAAKTYYVFQSMAWLYYTDLLLQIDQRVFDMSFSIAAPRGQPSLGTISLISGKDWYQIIDGGISHLSLQSVLESDYAKQRLTQAVTVGGHGIDDVSEFEVVSIPEPKELLLKTKDGDFIRIHIDEWMSKAKEKYIRWDSTGFKFIIPKRGSLEDGGEVFAFEPGLRIHWMAVTINYVRDLCTYLFIASIFLFALIFSIRIRRNRRIRRGLCPYCKYDLRGCGLGVGCPECGWNRQECEGRAGDN